MIELKLFYLFLIVTSSCVLGKSFEGRIIGGDVALAAQFPFAAAIYITKSNGNYFCGGVILSNEWILTAGQCVDGALLFTILMGTTNLQGTDSTTVKVATDTYVLHPDYNSQTLNNDIGLIRFRLSVSFSIYLDKINLPSEALKIGDSATAFGWGQTSDGDAGLVENLQWVNLISLSDSECKSTYGSQITDSMVCFSGSYNEGACIGDTGSPLIQRAGRGWTIVVAISSFVSGNGCESTDPSGYTKIFEYNDWIKNITTT